jgi:hypothetical protein
MSLVLKIERVGGFTWVFWNIASYFIHSKRNNLKFYIDDSEYVFKHTLGWNDYFNSIEIYKGQPIETPIQFISSRIYDIPIKITLEEYQEAFYFITNPTDDIKNKIKNTFIEYNIKKGEYDATFIRRGDKMFGESAYVDDILFVDLLINKGSTKIFLQTDDYQVYLNIVKYVKEKYPEKSIDVITLCPSWKNGTICYINEYNDIKQNKAQTRNPEYIKYLLENHRECVEEFSPEKMKQHCEEMLIGFTLCAYSRYFTCDFQSNVGRYLYTIHKNQENIDVLFFDKHIDFKSTHLNGILHEFNMK